MKDAVAEEKLTEQVVRRATRREKPKALEYEGSERVVSTGSTLLDLAISGGRFARGGIPSGILVEVFGPSSCGKTVLLCEIAGAIRRKKGQVLFRDPEARLNKRFARLFGFDVDEIDYDTANTVPEVFKAVRDWQPEPKGGFHAVFADSLAALTTDEEIEDKDKYGMRRAKEFSEQLRLTCRVLAARDLLMVCSNQIRQNLDAGPYGQRYKAPGGEAIGFYSSLRLRCSSPIKIKSSAKKIGGKEHTKILGVETGIEVYKSSVWEPYHSASLCILYDYGIDDIRANLRYVKETTSGTQYAVEGEKVGTSLWDAIRAVEASHLEGKLQEQVIGLWHETEEKFKERRAPKHREVADEV